MHLLRLKARWREIAEERRERAKGGKSEREGGKDGGSEEGGEGGGRGGGRQMMSLGGSREDAAREVGKGRV